MKHMKISDVEKMSGLSSSSVYRLMCAGKFPRPFRVSRQHVAWDRSEVEAWVKAQPSPKNPQRVPS